jgi:hypothetical protein
MARWQFANVHDRFAVSNEALELAQTLDERELVMQALSFRFVDLMELGHIQRADADATALEAAARELHVPYYQWATTLYAAMRAILEGRFADAELIVNESFEVGQRADRVAAMMAGAQFLILRREQGRMEEFQAIASAATGSVVLPLRAARILADIEAGREQRARLEFDAIAAADFADVPDDLFRSITLAILAEICSQLGDTRRADLLFALLLPHREQIVLLTFAVVFMGSVSHYLGILARTRGAWDEAADHLEDAMACHARLGAAPFHTRTRLEYVRMLLARNATDDQAAVRPLIDSIVEDADRLGMQAVLREAESLRESLT